MGMSTSVTGFRPTDEKWKKMRGIYDACKVAGIAPPQEVYDFFGEGGPDEAGVNVNIRGAVKEYKTEYGSGYEVHLDKLPKDVKIIRFVNSW